MEKLKASQITKFLVDKMKNIVRKGENACDHIFFFSYYVFQDSAQKSNHLGQMRHS